MTEKIKIFSRNLKDFHSSGDAGKTITNLAIPFFQRQYRWDEKQWNVSLESIEKIIEGEYFMGSLIMKAYPNEDKIDLIDGQQRITTLAIFLKALSDKFGKSNEIKDLIINKINHNRIDKKAFDFTMQKSEDEIKAERKIELDWKRHYKAVYKNEAGSQIYKCYDYFRMQFEEKLEEELKMEEKPQEGFKDNVNKFFENLEKVIFGVILLGEHDKQQIFDTLNSNQVSLTQAELLKNYLFDRNEKSYEENWANIFEKEDNNYWEGGSGRKNIDSYLFSLYYFTHPIKKVIKESDLLLKYKQGDKNKWISLVSSNAKFYKENIKSDILRNHISQSPSELEKLNIMVFGFGIHTLIPYMFYLATLPEKQKNEVEKIARYLQGYLIRRLLCDYETRGYNNFFVGLIGKDTLSELKTAISIETEEESKQERARNKLDKIPFQENFKTKFQTSTALKHEEAKIILYLLEIKMRENNILDENIRKFAGLTLEHINPQKPQKPYTDKMQKFIHTMGNFTLLTGKLNSAFNNLPWDSEEEFDLDIKVDGKTIKGTKKQAFKDKTSGVQIMEEWIKRDMCSHITVTKRAIKLWKTAEKLWGDEALK